MPTPENSSFLRIVKRDPSLQSICHDAVVDYRARYQPAQPPTDEEWERLEAHEGLLNLIKKYGAARVMTWVRSLAVICGEEV